MPILDSQEPSQSSARHAMAVTVLSVVILLLLQAVPWGSLTGNRLKDFNLFADIFPHETSYEPIAAATDIDPELQSYMDESTLESEAAEPEVYAESVVVPQFTEAPRVDGRVVIEDYSSGGDGMADFRAALASATERLVRVAVLGDSYIEGDILVQDLRRLFRLRFGGKGVGYMAMHSEFPGFRRSVRQSDSGWKAIDVRTMRNSDTLRTIAGEYARVDGVKAKSRFEGSGRPDVSNSSWSRSRFAFISTDSGSVTLTIDGLPPQTYPCGNAGKLQVLSLDGPTSSFTVESDAPGLRALGVWLDAATGVAVDCMSVRGNSGVGLRRTDKRLTDAMSHHVSYDLIIMEYGMNALSAEQKEYGGYSAGIAESISRLQELYPDASLLLMGVGDRGFKDGAAVKSLSTCSALVEAQRNAARRCGVMFFDTRAAQGGEGSVVEWRKRGLVNADYIHLNHDGGAALAEELFFAIMNSVDE